MNTSSDLGGKFKLKDFVGTIFLRVRNTSPVPIRDVSCRGLIEGLLSVDPISRVLPETTDIGVESRMTLVNSLGHVLDRSTLEKFEDCVKNLFVLSH